MKKILFYAFVLYGVFALIISINEDRMKKTKLYSYIGFLVPRNYEMFVGFPTRKGEITYFFYNEKDTLKINGTQFFQNKVREDFPFMASSFYPLSSMDFDFRIIDHSYAKKHWNLRYKDKVKLSKLDSICFEFNIDKNKKLIKRFKDYQYLIREDKQISEKKYPKVGFDVHTAPIKLKEKIKANYFQIMGKKTVLSYYE